MNEQRASDAVIDTSTNRNMNDTSAFLMASDSASHENSFSRIDEVNSKIEDFSSNENPPANKDAEGFISNRPRQSKIIPSSIQIAA